MQSQAQSSTKRNKKATPGSQWNCPTPECLNLKRRDWFRMTRKCKFVFAVGLAVGVCLMLCGGWIFFQPGAPTESFGVPKGNFGRIDEGMTLAEVEAILGQPGVLESTRLHPGTGEVESMMTWRVDNREWAIIGFVNSRLSTSTSWAVYFSNEETVLEKICRWLGQIARW